MLLTGGLISRLVTAKRRKLNSEITSGPYLDQEWTSEGGLQDVSPAMAPSLHSLAASHTFLKPENRDASAA